MRITRGQLQDLINEEISSALLERQNRRLLEEVEEHQDSTPASQFLEFAQKYFNTYREDKELISVLKDVIKGRGENHHMNDVMAAQSIFGGYGDIDSYFQEALTVAQTDDEDDDGTWAAAVRANR